MLSYHYAGQLWNSINWQTDCNDDPSRHNKEAYKRYFFRLALFKLFTPFFPSGCLFIDILSDRDKL